LIKTGLVITVVWGFFLCILIFFKFEDFLSLKLNELGDFSAGAFAPIAFFWLIIGYFQQGKELKLNRGALTAQVVELRQTVEQQKVMAEAATESLRISVKQFAEAAKAESRRWQPIFKFIDSDSKFVINDEVRFVLRFDNLGQDVSNVSFSIDEPSDVYMSAAKYEHPIWERGEKVELLFFANSDNYPRIEGFVLGVVYHDALGERQVRRLIIILRAGKVIDVRVEHAEVLDIATNFN
jgi:hypothetical protein